MGEVSQMRQLLRLAAVLTIAMLGVGCGSADSGDGELTVVVSTTILGDIVANVVGTDAVVEVLIPVGVDPHDYQLSSAQVATMNRADLVVVNGWGLEGGMSDVIDALQEDGVNVVEVAPTVDPLPSGEPDPHVWMDPVRVIEVVRTIESSLAAIEPTVDWSTASNSYVAELEGLHTEMESLLGVILSANRRLVTNHDSLEYLAARYDLEIMGVVVPGGSTLSDPSSAELAALVAIMDEEQLDVIFAETTTPDDLAKAVASELGRDVEVVDLYTGSLGEPGTEAESYLGMMKADAELISRALS